MIPKAQRRAGAEFHLDRERAHRIAKEHADE